MKAVSDGGSSFGVDFNVDCAVYECVAASNSIALVEHNYHPICEYLIPSKTVGVTIRVCVEVHLCILGFRCRVDEDGERLQIPHYQTHPRLSMC